MIYTNNLQSNCETMKHIITAKMKLILHASGVKINEEEVMLDLKGLFGCDEIERIENSGEKIDFMGVWLERREKWKISGVYVFFPFTHQNYISPILGRK